MAKLCYILLLLLNIGLQSFKQANQQVCESAASSDCTFQQTDYLNLVGIQGEEIICFGGSSINSSVPTHYSGSHERVSFGKNRTGTSFLRRMLHHCQSYFIAYRGEGRHETSPFCTSVGSTYYVYALRRLLC